MYFIYRRDLDLYNTIHACDYEKFLQASEQFTRKLSDGTYEPCENKFVAITDKSEIKQILEDRYSSKNRGTEYTTGLPSATLISSALFPMDVEKKFNILNWQNGISTSDYKAQQVTNKLSTDSGTFLHEVIELCLTDNVRIFDKSRNLQKYINIVCEDKKIITMIDNFADRKQYFVDMATKTLTPFFENEIKKIDPVFCELFLVNEYLQGSIDGVFYSDKKLYIYDWKTSKKANSEKMIYEKYARQLYIYSRMLLRAGVISQQEYNNLGFRVGFFNWNSGKSAIYEYSKSDIGKSSAYVNFVLSWYWTIKNGEKTEIIL